MYKSHCSLAAVLWPLALVLCPVVAFAQPDKTIVQVEVSPIVRLTAGEISACGVRFTTREGGITRTAEFVLENELSGRQFRLAGWADPPMPLADIALKTGTLDTQSLLSPAKRAADGTVSAQGAIPGLLGSELVRSLMVAGGTLELTASDAARPWSVNIPGPMAHQIRSSYLNCAGDLERPEAPPSR